MSYQGGMAGIESVAFVSERLSVKAKKMSGENVQVSVKKRKPSIFLLNLNEKWGEIPILRAIVVWFHVVKMMFATSVAIRIFMGFILLMEAIRIYNTGETPVQSGEPVSQYIFVLWGFSVLYLIWFVRNYIFNYHGAEHKVANCIDQGLSLTLENVMRQSKIHKSCGTNLVVGIMLLTHLFTYSGVLGVFGGPNTLSYIVALYMSAWIISPALAIEMFHPSNARTASLMTKFGGFVQKYITTVEPTEVEVRVACIAMETLLHMEEHGGLPNVTSFSDGDWIVEFVEE